MKSYAILGLHWGLYNQRAPHLVAECHADLTRLVSEGSARPLVSARLPLDGVADGL